MKALGAKHGVLTAKHGSGFLLWPTNTTLPDGSPYRYGVMTDPSSFQQNVLQLFSDSMAKAGLGHGFYYSTPRNFYLNRVDFKPAVEPLLPGHSLIYGFDSRTIIIRTGRL